MTLTHPFSWERDVQGRITQDTLSIMIRNDELAPTRTRRRPYYTYPGYGDATGKLPYPSGMCLSYYACLLVVKIDGALRSFTSWPMDQESIWRKE
jgi:hypothetical protein